MAKELILKGLQQAAKSLEESGRVRVATNFRCVIHSFITDRFKAYFVDEKNADGRTVTKTVLPEHDEDGNPICPEGAREVDTIRVVLSPLNAKGEEMESVIGFVLATSVRGLPAGLNPVGMVAYATGVEAVRKNGDRAGEIGYFVSGIDVLEENPAIQTFRAAQLGGLAMYTRK